MMISHKHKYLFIETPLTASTAIASELYEYYCGEPILYKHANYMQFKKIASSEEKKYFVFAGVRNPLDEIVSRYMKYLSNHNNRYTDETQLLRYGGSVTKKEISIFKYVQRNNNTFEDYFRKFYKHPFTSNISINKKYCNYIYSFEKLQEDFSKILELLNISQIKPLPIINVTENKKYYEEYYKDIINYAMKICGPFMLEWKYEPPNYYNNKDIEYIDKIKYGFMKQLRLNYIKYVLSSPLNRIKLLQEITQ